jgi:hypothetical protein
VAARTRVHRFVVERRAKHLGLGEAPSIGPHIDGRDGMPARVEAEEPMPECRHTDPTGLLGRPIGVDRVQACDDRLQQPVRVVLDAAVRSEPRGVLHLVGAPCDRPTFAVVKRGPRGRGPDVERDDH